MNVKRAILSTTTLTAIAFGGLAAIGSTQAAADWPWDGPSDNIQSHAAAKDLSDVTVARLLDWPWD
jgi:hypothetical protein